MTGPAVAIQGEAGSYSHAAALQVHGPDVRLVPRPSFDALFAAVVEGAAARGVVPIENSLAGSVHENYDLLRAHALHVVGETAVRVRHCLVVRPGTRPDAIRRVASHPVALAQCRRFFAGHPELVPVPAYDTAGSVRDLMEQRLLADAVQDGEGESYNALYTLGVLAYERGEFGPAAERFRDADRMVERGRELNDAMTQADALGALARGGEEDLGSAGVRVLLKEVVLDLPDVVEAETVGDLDLLQRVVEQLLLGALVPGARELVLVEQPESHVASSWSRMAAPTAKPIPVKVPPREGRRDRPLRGSRCTPRRASGPPPTDRRRSRRRRRCPRPRVVRGADGGLRRHARSHDGELHQVRSREGRRSAQPDC